MAGPVVARCYRIVYDRRSTDEANFCLNLLHSFLLHLSFPLAFWYSGIFGQATTEAASTAKARRWRDRWGWKIYWIGGPPGMLVCVHSCLVPSPASSASSYTLLQSSVLHTLPTAAPRSPVSTSERLISSTPVWRGCGCNLRWYNGFCSSSHCSCNVRLRTESNKVKVLFNNSEHGKYSKQKKSIDQ